MTRDLQSSQIQIFLLKNLKKSFFKYFFFQTLKIFEIIFCLPEKKEEEKICYLLSFQMLGGLESTRDLQSSLFHNPGGGGPLRLTEKEDEGKKTLCLILDCFYVPMLPSLAKLLLTEHFCLQPNKANMVLH